MNRKTFFIDKNNKKYKWLGLSFIRTLVIPIIDAFVLLIVFTAVPGIIFSLHMPTGYIELVLTIIVLEACIAAVDMLRYMKIEDTIIVKEGKDISIIKVYTNKAKDGILPTIIGASLLENPNSIIETLAGAGLYISGISKMQNTEGNIDEKIINEMNNIIKTRPDGYEFTDYKNCKLVSKRRNYYKFIGDKDGKTSSFKIYRVYKNIDLIAEEGK